MKRRVEAGQGALSGMFTRAEVTYAWSVRTGPSAPTSNPSPCSQAKPVHAYLDNLPDSAIVAMLNELAGELGAALGQERLYVAFADGTWILDARDREHIA